MATNTANTATYIKPLTLSECFQPAEIHLGFRVVTPAQAKTLLEEFNFKNRPKKRNAIRNYASLIRDNRWSTSSIHHIVIGSNRAVLDGQHRLEAIVEADKPVAVYFIVGVDPVELHNIDGNEPRSGGVRVFLSGESIGELEDKILGNLLKRENNWTTYKPLPHQLVAAQGKYSASIRKVMAILNSRDAEIRSTNQAEADRLASKNKRKWFIPSYLRRVGWLSAASAAIRLHPEKGEEFVRTVVEDKSGRQPEGCPTRKLTVDLIEMMSANGSRARDEYARCLGYFQAYLDGEVLVKSLSDRGCASRAEKLEQQTA